MDYCRLCARSDKKPLLPILDNNPLNITEKLQKLLKIRVLKSSKLPTNICLECLTKLNQFNEFSSIATENQIILEIIFGEKSESTRESTELFGSLKEDDDKFTTELSDEQVYIIEELSAETQTPTHEATYEQFESMDEPITEAKFGAQKPVIGLESSDRTKKNKFSRFDCYICSQQFPGNLSFTQHFRLAHPGDEVRYSCFICPNAVKKYRSYTRHLKSHTEKRFSCDICDRSFLQKVTLFQHLNSHSNVKLFKCEECGLEFKQNASLFKHRKQKHSNETPTCLECSKTFVNNDTLSQHMKSKHKAEKDIDCSDCAKKFASRSALIYHRSSQHQKRTDDEGRSCGTCHKKFKTSVILSRHIKNFHS